MVQRRLVWPGEGAGRGKWPLTRTPGEAGYALVGGPEGDQLHHGGLRAQLGQPGGTLGLAAPPPEQQPALAVADAGVAARQPRVPGHLPAGPRHLLLHPHGDRPLPLLPPGGPQPQVEHGDPRHGGLQGPYQAEHGAVVVIDAVPGHYGKQAGVGAQGDWRSWRAGGGSGEEQGGEVEEGVQHPHQAAAGNWPAVHHPVDSGCLQLSKTRPYQPHRPTYSRVEHLATHQVTNVDQLWFFAIGGVWGTVGQDPQIKRKQLFYILDWYRCAYSGSKAQVFITDEEYVTVIRFAPL